MNTAPVTYRLVISPSLERFRPELEFACRFLDMSYPVALSPNATRALYYGSDPPSHHVHVPAVLFPGMVRIDENGIHLENDELERFEVGDRAAPFRLLPGDGSAANGGPGSHLRYDALGLVFLLLSHVEERGNRACLRDRYGRFPYDAAFLHRHGKHAVPLADFAIRDIATALIGSEPRPRRDYRVFLTHDVDRLRGYHTPFEPIRRAAADVVIRRDPAAALRRLSQSYFSGEPWRSADWLMSLSEQVGWQSQFFFMGPTDHRMDSPYVRREPGAVRRLARRILSRGHAVGFHPGFETRGNLGELVRQKTGLEAVLGCPVDSGRHHCLLFDADRTWDMWANVGMRVDMTLGYPEVSGFPSGTTRRHPTYSLRERRTLGLIEFPTNILDFGFFDGRYRDLSVAAALTECEQVVATSRSLGGDLVILFHTSNPDKRWRQFYRELMRLI